MSATHLHSLRSFHWLWGALCRLLNVVTCQWIPTGLFGMSCCTFTRVSITTTILPLSAAPYSISLSTYTDGLWSWTFIANFLFGQERGKAIYGQLLEQPLLNAQTHDTFWLAPLLDGGIASSSVHIPLYIYFAPPLSSFFLFHPYWFLRESSSSFCSLTDDCILFRPWYVLMHCRTGVLPRRGSLLRLGSIIQT